jgi:hypothetical protein
MITEAKKFVSRRNRKANHMRTKRADGITPTQKLKA